MFRSLEHFLHLILKLSRLEDVNELEKQLCHLKKLKGRLPQMPKVAHQARDFSSNANWILSHDLAGTH